MSHHTNKGGPPGGVASEKYEKSIILMASFEELIYFLNYTFLI